MVLTQFEFIVQTHAIRCIGRVGSIGQCQQFLDFRIELGIEFDDVAVRQRFAARCMACILVAPQHTVPGLMNFISVVISSLRLEKTLVR